MTVFFDERFDFINRHSLKGPKNRWKSRLEDCSRPLPEIIWTTALFRYDKTVFYDN